MTYGSVMTRPETSVVDVGGMTRITVYDHKSDLATGEPLSVPVSAQLRLILLDAFERMGKDTTHVVQYRGKPIDAIRYGLRESARQVGIPWGRCTAGGVTLAMGCY